jgi:hypothetical protein
MLPLTGSNVLANTPDMICRGTISVAGDATPQSPQQRETTDVFRVWAGRLYHSSHGREEYLYNAISEVGPGRYTAGHMLFVMAQEGSRRGYVVIAAPTDWRIVYLECQS